MDFSSQYTDSLIYEVFSDTVIESDLNLNEIEIFLSILDLFDISFGIRFFFIIVDSQIIFGLLENITPKSEKCLLENSSRVSGNGNKQNDTEIVLKLLQQDRAILILSLSGEPFMVINSGIVKEFTERISQEITNETLIKRKLDCDILFALFLTQSFNGINGNQHNSLTETADTNSRRHNDRVVTKDTSVTVKQSKQSRISAVSPRKPHSTTSTDVEIVFPNNRKDYNQLDYPNYGNCERQQTFGQESFPIQATETDAGQFSFEPSFSRHMSSSAQGSRNFNHEEANVYSAQDLQHERRNASERLSDSPEPRLRIPTKLPRFPDYIEHQKRLESFNTFNWPIDNKPNSFSLAECGFFYTDKQDLVRCHQCGIGLKDWVADDDVLTEHVKHSSLCDFLVETYGKNRIDSMKLMIEAGRNNGSNSSTNIPQVPYKIRSPRYQTMEARIASFWNFPKQSNIPHQQLAVAGLFYTGQGDLCRCFTCDGGLKDWSSGDDPVKEHAKYFPRCSYIIKLKGVAYIEMQQQNRPTNEQMGAAGGCSNDVTQPIQTFPNLQVKKLSIVDTDTEYSSLLVTQIVQQMGYSETDVIIAKAELEREGNKKQSAEDVVNTLLDIQERNRQSEAAESKKETSTGLQAIVEENKKLTSLIYCMLCVTGEADILFLPCTHHRVCHECSKDIIFCPVCNEFIKEKVKTFRA